MHISQGDVYRSGDARSAAVIAHDYPVVHVLVFKGDQLVSHANVESLEIAAGKMVGGNDIHLSFNSLRGDRLYAEAYTSLNRSSKLCGVVEFDAQTLAVRNFYPLLCHRVDLQGSKNDRILISPNAEKPDIFLLTTYLFDEMRGFVHGCYIYRLRASEEPEALLAVENAFVDFTPEGAGFLMESNKQPHFYIDDAKMTREGKIAFAIDEDSTYSVDIQLGKRELRRIFHPGRMSIATDAHGLVFLFSQKGAKAGFLGSD